MIIKYSKHIKLILFIVTTIVLASCAHKPPECLYNPDPLKLLLHQQLQGVPGFWEGIFHGITIIPSFIGRCWVDPSIRMYAFPNSGLYYEAGFAIGSVLGIPFMFFTIPFGVLALALKVLQCH